MRLTLDYPPVWLVGFMALASLAAVPWAPLGDVLLWPGRVLIVLGLGLMVWAAVAFRRARTTIVPHERPSALVETGPFRYSRNPIYVADLMILAGWALGTGQPLGLVLLWPFQRVLTARFIEKEEAMLAADLGPPYSAYRARVRRWI